MGTRKPALVDILASFMVLGFIKPIAESGQKPKYHHENSNVLEKEKQAYVEHYKIILRPLAQIGLRRSGLVGY